MRARPKPLKLKGIHRLNKKQAGAIKVYLYQRATGLPLDPDELAENHAAVEKKMRAPRAHAAWSLRSRRLWRKKRAALNAWADVIAGIV
jgi:hypothetical protein